MDYYNDNDENAAAWLRELIAAGLIPPGDVDTRSIVDVQPDDLRKYRRVHMFAGIGGWPLALQRAGIEDDRRIWTGSCPCQPFSGAGKQLGEQDERHLWPEFKRLIEVGRPAVLLGEQVASKLGRDWLARVRADLEDMAYGVGAADLCSAGAGAPHIRQRLWWVAYASSERRTGEHPLLWAEEGGSGEGSLSEIARSGTADGLADAQRDAREPGWLANQSREGAGAAATGSSDEPGRRGVSGRLAYPDGGLARYGDLQPGGQHGQQLQDGGAGGLAYTGRGDDAERVEHTLCTESERQRLLGISVEPKQEAGRPSYANAWSDYDIVRCSDGKARRFKPGIFPLAHGVPGRVGLLRGAGNAINPELAAIFIRACEEARRELAETQ